jgi:hypothetical protein
VGAGTHRVCLEATSRENLLLSGLFKRFQMGHGSWKCKIERKSKNLTIFFFFFFYKYNNQTNTKEIGVKYRETRNNRLIQGK